MDAVDRPLGSTENVYWLLDRLYCRDFVVYAELDGALALNLLYDRNKLPAARAKTIGRRLLAHLEAAAR